MILQISTEWPNQESLNVSMKTLNICNESIPQNTVFCIMYIHQPNNEDGTGSRRHALCGRRCGNCRPTCLVDKRSIYETRRSLRTASLSFFTVVTVCLPPKPFISVLVNLIYL